MQFIDYLSDDAYAIHRVYLHKYEHEILKQVVGTKLTYSKNEVKISKDSPMSLESF